MGTMKIKYSYIVVCLKHVQARKLHKTIAPKWTFPNCSKVAIFVTVVRNALVLDSYH